MRIAHSGVEIYPRLEAQIRSKPYHPARPQRRAQFGIAKLDELLHGGIPTPSTTVLAGTTGVGKTLLSLQFLAEGASKGEPGVYLSFSEEPEPLIAPHGTDRRPVAPVRRKGPPADRISRASEPRGGRAAGASFWNA